MALNTTSYNATALLEQSQSSGSFMLNYLFSLPALVLQGDYFAIMISLIVGYILLILINKLTGLFLVVIKKTIFMIITLLAILLTYSKFQASLAANGFSLETVLIGIVGILVAVLGMVISAYAFFKSSKKAMTTPWEEHQDAVEKHVDINQMKDFKTFFSLSSLKNDKSMLSVLTFLIVAEFGVFSSATISAPNVKIGLTMFIIFMIATFVFIKQSYHNYMRGLTHITITFVLGMTLAVILGHYWSNIPFSTLFSLEFFATEATVAVISGMALSLFAGSKS